LTDKSVAKHCCANKPLVCQLGIKPERNQTFAYHWYAMIEALTFSNTLTDKNFVFVNPKEMLEG